VAHGLRAEVSVTWPGANRHRSRCGRRAGECDRGDGSATSAGA
jgi:hypothetical protein